MNGTTLAVVLAAVMGLFQGQQKIADHYQYERRFGSYWELSDKSSSLDAKAAYIDQFVEALEDNRSEFADHNALFLSTPNNSFDRNLQAVTSLRARLAEIKTMDPRSFEYQTAISQITAQEQGEASEMLGVLHGCWTLKSHPFVWDWLGLVVLGAWVLTLFVAGSILVTP
jgi:hypothetical protein